MEFFKKATNIDFLGKKKHAAIFSGLLILVSIISLFTRGLNFGIDFTGGTLIEVGYPQAVELPQVRDALTKGGFSDAVAQHFGTAQDVLIRIAPRAETSSADISNKVMDVLKEASNNAAQMRRVEFVGPQVGEDLAEDGGLAMLYTLIAILIYVAMRFEYRFSVGAIAALIHDTIITVGVFSITGVQFDLTVLAALLAVIGYSLNDTIVVFDRIRENFRKIRKGSAEEVLNASLNQTLSRTIMTSFLTFLAVIALFFFGGETLHGFSLALLVGIVVGTYSSIYVASAAALALGVSKADLMPVQKEGAELDNMP